MSSYAKKGKTPYRYSPQYYSWRNAFTRGGDVDHAHMVWEQAHGLRSNKATASQTYATVGVPFGLDL